MAGEKPSNIPEAKLFRCKVTIDVRWRDLDPMGHVNNAVYLTYFETARVTYRKIMIPDEKVIFPFILASATVNYLAPASLGERLIVHIRVSHVGAKSFEYAYLITDEVSGHAIATGSTVQVGYDYENKKTIDLPPKFRQWVEDYEGHKI